MDIKPPEIPEDTLNELIEIGDKHLGDTYDKLIMPSAEGLGTGISAIINLIFSPIKYFGSKVDLKFSYALKKYEQELAQKIQSIPEENRIEPDIHTTLEIMENSRFCITNDELRAMFVNLIAETMNSETAGFVHPAFATIIRQMSPLDAKIVQVFKELGHAMPLPYLAYQLTETDDVRVKISVDNLVRLGVLQRIHSMNYNLATVELTEYDFELTTFGKQFSEICCQ